MKHLLIFFSVAFTAALFYGIVKLFSWALLFGMFAGSFLTVFISIFVLKYIEIEEKKKKLADVKPIYQNSSRKSDSGNDISKSSDTERSE